MQKGFGLIGILIIVGIIVGIGAFVFTSVFPGKNPFVPSTEEKSAIDMAQQIKDEVEEKNNKTISDYPTPDDETVNWKTYRNEEYGFELSYPMGWKISRSDSGRQFTLQRSYRPLDILGSIDIFQNDNPNFLPIDEVVKKYETFNILGSMPYDFIPGINAVIESKEQFILFTYDDDVYLVYRWRMEPGDKEILDKILSTFKFLP